jgi:sugar lactone lactonase YvrE
LVKEIILPVPMPTNCAFGGDDLSVLYVTSTWIRLPPGLSAQAPASGQLIAVQTDTRGQTPARFRKPN